MGRTRNWHTLTLAVLITLLAGLASATNYRASGEYKSTDLEDIISPEMIYWAGTASDPIWDGMCVYSEDFCRIRRYFTNGLSDFMSIPVPAQTEVCFPGGVCSMQVWHKEDVYVFEYAR